MIKDRVPTKEEITPIGISSGENMVLDTRSASIKKPDPIKIERGRIFLKFAPTISLTR